jgi:acetyl-CoA C-acetyltransferase
MACEMLGLAQDDPRGFTLTGGLPYAGGPGNSYSLHSFAAAVHALRQGEGKNAFVTGNGWYLTKHSASLLSREPSDAAHPPNAAQATDTTRARWDAPAVEICTEANGPGTVETYTVVHGPDGAPERGIVIGRLDETHQRFLANTSSDPTLLEDLESREIVGTQGRVEFRDGANLFDPA